MERRRRWSGEAPTIPEGLVRVSVGVENIEDLDRDLLGALEAAGGGAGGTDARS
nr:PLP-dependent transferase [Rubellimicrobium arenae]